MTQPGGGSSSVHTFIFKTVGSAAVSGAVASAQKHVNGLVGSVERATAATKRQRVSAEMAAAIQQKMNANIAAGEVRIEAFTRRINNNLGVMARSKTEFYENEKALDALNRALQQNNKALDAANLKSTRDNAAKRKLRDTGANLRDQIGQLAQRQAELNATIDKAIQREKLYAASLKAREARLNLLKVKTEEASRPLTKFEQFIATAIKVNKVVGQIAITMDRLTRSANRVAKILNTIDRIRNGRRAGGGAGETGTARDIGVAGAQSESVVVRLQNRFNLLGHVAAEVLGRIIFGGIVRVTQALIGMVQASVSAISGFERMAISLRAIIGVQKMNADSTLELSDALASSSKESIALIGWLEKLAILSPFSSEDVKQAFQNAISMGFNVEQSKRLTTATLDWAAANGKSGAQAEHVVFVLGQMRNASKLTYQDQMQLAQMGIGMDTINRALAKSLGKTVEEILRMREAGQITASQAIPALIAYMEQFSGAAKDQANTLEGLMSSLGDIGPIFQRAFFGPMNEATGKIDGVVGAIQKRLQGLVEFLQSGYLKTLATSIGRGFGVIADNALTWGENVTIQFANGLINGLWAVMDSLVNIGGFVASWLAPHSPPKIMPDIDKWGMETLNEYFKGFKLADFSLFKDIGDQISSTLQSALSLGSGDDLGVLQTILDIRTKLAAAIAGSGSVGDIFSGVSGVPPELKAYVETMFQIAQQSKAVDEAQKALNDTIKHYDELLKPVDDQLQTISDEQQNLADDSRIAQLRLIANDPNATAAEKRMALLEIERLEAEKNRRAIAAEAKQEIDAKQEALDAELEKLAVLEEQAALQKAFLDQQGEQNRLLQQYVDLVNKMMDAAKGGAGGPDRVAASAPWGSGLPEGMSNRGGEKPSALDERIAAFVEKFKAKIAELQAAWGEAWARMQEKLQPVFDAWERVRGAATRLKDAVLADAPLIEEAIGRIIAKFTESGSDVGTAVLTIVANLLDRLAIFWEEHGETIISGVTTLTISFIDFSAKVILGVSAVLVMLGALGAATVVILARFAHFVSTAKERWHEFQLKIASVLLAVRAIIVSKFIEFANFILEKLNFIKDFWADTWNRVIIKIRSTFREVGEIAVEKMAEVLTSITTNLDAAILYLTNLKDEAVAKGADFVQGIIDGIASMAGALARAVAGMVAGMFTTASNEAESESPSKRAMREIGLPIPQGAALGILKGMPVVNKAMASMVGGAITPPASGRQQWGQHTVNNNNSTQFVLNANMSRDADSVVHEFAVMQAMYGGA